MHTGFEVKRAHFVGDFRSQVPQKVKMKKDDGRQDDGRKAQMDFSRRLSEILR
jgi:hypothetical protein